MKRRRKMRTAEKIDSAEEEELSENSEDIYDNNYIIDRLTTDRNKLGSLLAEVKQKIKEYKQIYLKEQEQTMSTPPLRQR